MTAVPAEQLFRSVKGDLNGQMPLDTPVVFLYNIDNIGEYVI